MPVSISHIFWHYFLSDHHKNTTNPSYVNPNGPILAGFKTLHHVVVSTAETETGGIFINVQNNVLIWTALIELKHLQLKTTLKKDNSTLKGYYNCSIQQK